MKRFRFALETVLTLRKNAADQRKREFAGALATLKAKEREVSEIQRSRADAASTVSEVGVGPIDPREFLAWFRHIAHLDRRETEERTRAGDLAREVDARRVVLGEAMKEHRVVEKLKDKRVAEWRRDADREERKVLDDLNDAARVRAMRAEAIR